MSLRRKLRIAWIGDPSQIGGVGSMCLLLLKELAASGLVELDVYTSNTIEKTPELKPLAAAGAKILEFPISWEWHSWYGRNKKAAFVMSFLKRMAAHQQKVRRLLENHRALPYDAVIQFSQAELLGLRRHVKNIRLILFPCVHAGGELEWSRKEAHLARRCEPQWWITLRDAYLAYRTRIQKRDYNLVSGVIGMSRKFNELVARDYAVPKERMSVVYQPVELPACGEVPARECEDMVRILFVGRISVRKGLDMVIEAARNVIIPDGTLELSIIGAGSLWSNYEPLLANLPSSPRIRWLRSLPNAEVNLLMSQSDILIVPSLYEPGGIVVAEALASGMIVVASDAVGSAENLSEEVCLTFKAGDQSGFEGALRRAITLVRNERLVLRAKAMQDARSCFDPASTARKLVEAIAQLSKEQKVVKP